MAKFSLTEVLLLVATSNIATASQRLDVLAAMTFVTATGLWAISRFGPKRRKR
jgi:hypothetical protein